MSGKADKATTLSGYGITDGVNTSDIGTAAAKNYTTSVTSGSTDVITSGGVYSAVSNKADKATTLAGYGITDGVTSSSLGTQCTYSLSGTTLTITSK